MRKQLSITLVLSMLWCLCWAQSTDKAVWENYLMEVINTEDYDEVEMEEVYEHLCELESNPLNINDATYDEMSQIPGLTIDQISDIMLYRDKYGAMKSMEELAMIPSISRSMRLFLSCFFVAEPSENDRFNKNSKWYREWWKGDRLDSIMRHGHGTVMTTGSIPLYSRKGDDGTYLGDKYKCSLKLKGKFSEFIQYGFIGAKDAGEPFFKGKNKNGFDYYSFFLNVNKIGRIKSLYVGRYRMKMGQGLVLNNGFSLGKQFLLTSLCSSETSITGHVSRSDGKYLQGVATTIDLSRVPYYNRKPYDKNWKVELTAFWSYRKIDATLDTIGNATTVITTGYHRTDTEMEKKNNASTLATGEHLSVVKGAWHAGVSAIYNWYNRDFVQSSTQAYRRYYPKGNTFWNMAFDYGYVSHRLTFTGETATGACGAIATINTAMLCLPNQLKLTAVQRFYSYKYFAMMAKSFSDGGYTQNESGFYLGASYPLLSHVTVDAYTDIAYFPWTKYLAKAGSYSWDNNVNITYSKGKWTTQGRYRYHLRQRTNAAKTGNADRNEHTFRLSALRTTNYLTLRTQLDYKYVKAETKTSKGYMVSEMATYKPGKIFSISLSAGYFNTDDYDSRVYLYEKGMLESFSFASAYGEGFRVSTVVRADMSRAWMLMLKAGHTKYFDRSEISSSYRLIEQSYQTDIDVQLRYRF